MKIKITNENGNLVFEGLAEDWLFNNSCDSELEIALNQLEQSRSGSIEFYCEENDTLYLIEKILELIYD